MDSDSDNNSGYRLEQEDVSAPNHVVLPDGIVIRPSEQLIHTVEMILPNLRKIVEQVDEAFKGDDTVRAGNMLHFLGVQAEELETACMIDASLYVTGALLTSDRSGEELREVAVKYRNGEDAVYRTKKGSVLTDADIAKLADEAEAGYDVEHLRNAPSRRDGV